MNLTELKRKPQQKSERKRLRANDYDVIPVDPEKQTEEENKKDIDDEHVSIMDVTLEPGNEDQISICHCFDGPVLEARVATRTKKF